MCKSKAENETESDKILHTISCYFLAILLPFPFFLHCCVAMPENMHGDKKNIAPSREATV